jgi:hypothetical protein
MMLLCLPFIADFGPSNPLTGRLQRGHEELRHCTTSGRPHCFNLSLPFPTPQTWGCGAPVPCRAVPYMHLKALTESAKDASLCEEAGAWRIRGRYLAVVMVAWDETPR